MKLRRSVVFILVFITQVLFLQKALAVEWVNEFNCENALVVDVATGRSRTGIYEMRQLVLRDSKAIQHFQKANAIPPQTVNYKGEFIYGGITDFGTNGSTYESSCDPEINICYVIRQLDKTNYRLEAWRTSYSTFGPQGLAAEWVFYNCH